MNQKSLFLLWGGLFSLCAVLGFIPEPAGILRMILTALSLAFFLPPAVLLYRGSREKNLPLLKLIRNLSALSLGLTLALLVASFLTALSAQWVGSFLHVLLVIVSSPMVCSGYWAVSLFLWACLLMASLSVLKNVK